jgi:hypothetical protein
MRKVMRTAPFSSPYDFQASTLNPDASLNCVNPTAPLSTYLHLTFPIIREMIGRRSLLALFATVVILCNLHNTPVAASSVAEYQPATKKKGLGRLYDWGLAKVEKLYDGVKVSDLISAFVTKFDHILHIMVHSFKDMTLSYTELHQKEVARLEQFDKEFKDLVKLRNKIDRKCLYSNNVDDRSACVERGIDVNSKIQDLRSQRVKSENSIKWYCEMIDWCASYKNWFC